jgi:xanthine dehydrogenase YagR molybdenum-binding subunit
MKAFGKEVNRVDGPAKVTGKAKYAGEFFDEKVLYGVVVSSTVTKGKIVAIDTSDCEKLPGIVKVFTHKNRPHISWFNKKYDDDDAPKGSHFKPLYDEEIYFSGQPVALVIAEDFETARRGSSLVRIDYHSEDHITDLEYAAKDADYPGKGKSSFPPPPEPKGHSEKILKDAIYKVETKYVCPPEHHNPMEPHASTVIYKDGKYIIYDKTQGVLNSKKYACNIFGLKEDDVQVRSPFVGGAFGSGLRPQYQLFMAVLAAKDLKASVRVTLTRQQMFTFGHRPNTLQYVNLAADASGNLLAIEHKAIAETSRMETYVENVVNWSNMLYDAPNVTLDYKVAELDVYTPLDMRAPGAAWGVNIFEMAMDELSYKLNLDPLELRLKNYTMTNAAQDKPFSSKELKKCFEEGAELFGWNQRHQNPRSMRRGNKLIGYGMATGIWHAEQEKASASVTLTKDGRAIVKSATADIGTGTYTSMTQIAADALNLNVEDVTFLLGDSTFPEAPLQGGSWTASSIGSAVQEASQNVLKIVQEKLGAKGSVDNIKEAMKIIGEDVECTSSAGPDPKTSKKFSSMTHSAYFVEVAVDADIGTVTVNRVVAAVAAGKIINPKTARSQVLGGVIWGMSMALLEESMMDHNLGRYMNHNLAEYHIPVHKDSPQIDVLFVEENDPNINSLGIKGLAEIGIVGAAAAIGNAIYHATGVRVRELPITMDKILMGGLSEDIIRPDLNIDQPFTPTLQ